VMVRPQDAQAFVGAGAAGPERDRRRSGMPPSLGRNSKHAPAVGGVSGRCGR
jgi:hypothetical protein